MEGTSVIPETSWRYVSPAVIADTDPDEVVAAVAGKKHYVCALQLSNTDTAVGTLVQVLSASTVLWSGFVGPYVAAAPGGACVPVVFPVPLMGAAGEAINVKCVTTSAEVIACLQGFTSPQ